MKIDDSSRCNNEYLNDIEKERQRINWENDEKNGSSPLLVSCVRKKLYT